MEGSLGTKANRCCVNRKYLKAGVFRRKDPRCAGHDILFLVAEVSPNELLPPSSKQERDYQHMWIFSS